MAAMVKPRGWAVLLACVLVGLCSQTACELDGSATHKRWIIITSISYPTDAIKVLATMTDWKVRSHSSPSKATCNSPGLWPFFQNIPPHILAARHCRFRQSCVRSASCGRNQSSEQEVATAEIRPQSLQRWTMSSDNA